MGAHYEAFCFADSFFYDEPGSRAGDEGQQFAVATRTLPDGWREERLGDWLVVRRADDVLPMQGWKVHVSACPDNADDVLALVWDYCVDQQLTFKFLSSPVILLARNSKYAGRAGSGKLATIYPPDERALRQVCEQLGETLRGQPGPYILSDLRWGAGPLYVRYGGFTERRCPGPGGEPVLAIEQPDGTLVPDHRRPVFTVPDWVQLPEFLTPQLAARTGPSPAMPYRVRRALHFSNGGGVYLAQHRRGDEEPVVLKEARPHAGLDANGADAVARLAREADTLDRLAGIDGIPRLLERFTVWEHHFVAMERVEGVSLARWMARNHPLTRSSPQPAQLADYAARATVLLDGIERLLDRIHARGIVYGDLHPHNVLVGPDDRVSLVDFELACPVEAPVRPGLGARGFAAPADRTGARVDSYALAALRLFLFLPLNAVLALEPGKLPQYLADVRDRFALPPAFTEPVAAELATPGAAPVPSAGFRRDWPAARHSAVAAILRSATPDRSDRLFPGDIAQFTTDQLGLAYGPAGVLHALDAVGAGRFPEHERWLVAAAAAAPPRRPGLYDGLAGLVWLLHRFGHSGAATAHLARLLDLLPECRDLSLFRGLAGVGAALLELSRLRAEPDLAEIAGTLGTRVATELAAGGRATRPGLLHGWSGAAVLFLALHEHTRCDSWLDHAERALAADLDGCLRTPDATLQVDADGRRSLPYLGVGSAGIAVALAQLAAVRPDASSCAALPELVRACEAEFVVHAGLCNGRAGLILALSAVRAAAPELAARLRVQQTIERHLDRLDWHAVRYRGGLAFPGDQLLRLSMDLATGSAGVLLAVSAALDDTGFDGTVLDADNSVPLLPGLVTRPARPALAAAAAP